MIFLFSDYVDSPNMQYDIGWVYLALVVFCLILNLILMVKNMAKSINNYVKLKIKNMKLER